MLEEILDRRNIEKALRQVERNAGAAGIDGMRWQELRPYINANWQELRRSILEGSYRASAVRKVEIDKPQGGKRVLGIPTVVDRMIGQAIGQWLSPRYESNFSNRSYGFRPNRNAHQAVLKAHRYVQEGRTWVVELDLEKFFDRINQDRLMSTLSRGIADKRVLKLIRGYLTSGILEGGIISYPGEGSPQGSPLSPILSNIVLDELDKELEKRGHSFVRYADDISIYVKSEASATRIRTGITRFIEDRMLLKVNQEKTKISQPAESSLLGFGFRLGKAEKWTLIIAEKSVERMKRKCKAITRRNLPLSERERIDRLNKLIRGWVNYFVIAKDYSALENLDSILRTRLRMCKWKQWKKPPTRIANLIKLGASRRLASGHGWIRMGYRRISVSYGLTTTLTNAYFAKQGYLGFRHYHYLQTAKQASLF